MTTATVPEVVIPSWSPSQLDNYEKCPCFARAPTPEGENDAAAEGTLMHLSAELEDLSILETEEQRQEVKKALDYIGCVKAGYGDRIAEIHKERPIRIGMIKKTGKMDVLHIHKAEHAWVEVFDFKFGRLDVTPADKSLQQACYALGVFDEFIAVNSVKIHIIAPRTDHVSSFVYERSMVPAIQMRIRNTVDNLFDAFKRPCSKTPDLCENCVNVARCPEMAGTAIALAKCLGLPMPTELDLSEGSKISPEDRMRAQVLGLAMESWATQVKRSNTAYVMAGGSIPYFGIRSRGGNYNITDSDAARAALLAAGFTEADIWQASGKLSFKTLVEIYSERSGVKKKDAQEALQTVIGPAGQQNSGASWLQRSTVLPWAELGSGTQALLVKPKEDDVT